MLAWTALEAAIVYPHFLAYFNQIAGGPAGGYRWLVDSNLDWGQDLEGLARYRREHVDGPFYVSYFGTAPPEAYGIDGAFLPGSLVRGFRAPFFRSDVTPFSNVPSGATVAVSATNLQCVYLTNDVVPGIEEFMRRLRGMRPVATVGHSILVYRMP
jgi:hypothetical protein